jgi:hypothetical protein
MWLLAMIQGSLTSDLNRFSGMTVIDRQYLDTILSEQTLSLSGNFSDEDYIRVGNLTTAQYIVTGSLIKAASDIFLLEIVVSNAETGERKASFGPRQYNLNSIRGMLAAKDAAHELLSQMNVQLTELGKMALYETVQSAIDAETSLAKGISAQRTGSTPQTNVETMYYLYEAQSFSPYLVEVEERLSIVQEQLQIPIPNPIEDIALVRTGNIREDAQHEIARYKAQRAYDEALEEQRRQYQQILLEKQGELINYLAACEEFFIEHPPFEVLYDPTLTREGKINYEHETVDLIFSVATIPTAGMNVMISIIQ